MASELVPIGASKDQLDTPALCLDLDAMESNIQAMAESCRCHGVAWRPHAKGHKSSFIARSEIAAGRWASPRKLAEAEIMAEGGVRDLLIANMIVGPRKVQRLVALRRQGRSDCLRRPPRPGRAVEPGFCPRSASAAAADRSEHRAQSRGNCTGRTGRRAGPGHRRAAGIRLAGVMGYEGHLLTLPDPLDKGRQIHAALERLVDTQRAYRASRAGVCHRLVCRHRLVPLCTSSIRALPKCRPAVRSSWTSFTGRNARSRTWPMP